MYSSISTKGKWENFPGKLLLCVFALVSFAALQSCMFVNAEDRVSSYQRYATSYHASGYELATYFIESGNNFFRGYFEVHFDRLTELQGLYTFRSLPICNYIENPPLPVSKEGLESQFCFVWDTRALKKLHGGKDESVTFKIYPHISLNVDPYSVRIYAYSPIKGTMGNYTFSPLVPSSDNTQPDLGPWEFTFKTCSEYLNTELNFIIFAKSTVEAPFDTPISINYPRQVDFPLTNYRLSLIYENATIIDPKVSALPTVRVVEDNREVNILADHKKIAQYMIEEDNLNRYGLDETRVFVMSHGTQVDDSFIDPTTIKCGYAFSDSDFKTLTIDPTIIVSEASDYLLFYRVACKRHVSHSKYLLSIMGKKYSYRRGYPDSSVRFEPGEVSIIPMGAELYVSVHQHSTLDGWFSIVTQGLETYFGVPLEETLQRPLIMQWVFEFEYANAKMGENLPNVNVLEMSFLAYMERSDVDPFSLRVFEYNEDKEMFTLVVPDSPTIWRANFEFDIGTALMKDPTKTKKVYAVASYKSVSENIGAIVYVNYNRKIQFTPISNIVLEMGFTYLSTENFLYSNRPYFTLSNYEYDSSIESEWTVLYSFMQQNGNGLDSYNVDEKRTFTVSYDFVKLDENGKQVPIKFSDLTCAYLFKESSFKSVEVSKPTLVFNDERREITIVCDEDVREESFAFMLVTRKYTPSIQSQIFDSEFGMMPTVEGHYSMYQYDLTNDALTISFNPSGRSSGTYKISRDLNSYDSYSIPNSEIGPLKIIASFVIDFSDMILFSSSIMDTQAFLKYEALSRILNLDPFSYRFFLINDNTKSFEWWNCKDEQTENVWYTQFTMDKTKPVKFAILGYSNSIGKFDTFYSIHYERYLTYSLGNDQQMTFTFSSETFPEFGGKARFVLQQNNNIDPHITKDLTIVKAGTIVQQVRNDITTKRSFTYSTGLKDLAGEPVQDLLSLQCLYTFSDKIIVGTSTITNDSTIIYNLECSDFVTSEIYDWVIVTKSIKRPSPQASTVHPVQTQQGTVVFLSLFVTFLIIVVIVLLVLVIYFAYTKKKALQNSSEEKIFNLDDMKHYSATINNTL